jgi:hypothetical protein
MAYMTLLILDDPNKLDAVLKNWSEGGIKGATIIESSGLYRRQKQILHMRYLFASGEEGEKENITLLAMVDDKAQAEECLHLAEQVIGNLDGPNTGIFAAWELDVIKGLKHDNSSGDA